MTRSHDTCLTGLLLWDAAAAGWVLGAASKNARCIQSTAETEDRRCRQKAQPYQPALTLVPQPSFPQAKPKRQFVHRRWDALPCNAPAAGYSTALLSRDQRYAALRSCSTSAAAIPNPQHNICCSWNRMKLQPFQLAMLSASESFLLDCYLSSQVFLHLSIFPPLFKYRQVETYQPYEPLSYTPQLASASICSMIKKVNWWLGISSVWN